jgi:hypothetical protein
MQDTWEPGLLDTSHTNQHEVADMNKLTKTLYTTAIAGAMVIPFTAVHAWGGPWGGQQLG